MFNKKLKDKKLKVEVPIWSTCENCNQQSVVNHVNMTHDLLLRACYKCEKCGHESCESQRVEFIVQNNKKG
ncbi:MAG: hypothetical protein RR942_06590 [Romboutsia sp.]